MNEKRALLGGDIEIMDHGMLESSINIHEFETTTSFTVRTDDDCEKASGDSHREEESDYFGFPVYSSKGGCMICREEVPLETFDDLNPGDHIATRGQICCFGCFYDHHAIVTEVKKLEGNRADIFVVDVNIKGTEYTIEHNKLCGKTWGIPLDPDPAIMTQKIKRINYKKRRNTPVKTKKLAENFARRDKRNNLQYRLFGQNCENFATACANGLETMSFDDLKDSISLQSRSCCWRFMHLLVWLLQGAFYAFNFCIYAVFVIKDKDFDHFSPGLHKFLGHLCYNPDNCMRGFDTRCDWMVVAFFIVAFTIIFIIAMCAFYQPLYAKGFICRQCLITARLDCFSRIFAFVIIEAASILLVNPLYQLLTDWDTGDWALLIMLGVSIVGAFIVYSVSSLFTWMLGMCCTPTCKAAREFTKYFEFRGVPWLVAWLVRCCRRQLRSKRKLKHVRRTAYEAI